MRTKPSSVSSSLSLAVAALLAAAWLVPGKAEETAPLEVKERPGQTSTPTLPLFMDPREGAFAPSPGRIVFLGDSITHAGHYITLLETYFRQNHGSLQATEWINLGLPSETCTGLSEPSHPFPRPNVHERLDRALDKTSPDVLVLCYGMNDGIYHPFDPQRFEAYQQGIGQLVEKAKTTGAFVVLLTPPPFDPLPLKQQGKLVPADGEAFAWHSVYENYADVIERYAEWILTQAHTVDMVIDIHTPIVQSLRQIRESEPNDTLSNDGVHLDRDGHRVIAEAILEAWGQPGTALNHALHAQLERRQAMTHAAWLSHVGHQRPGMKPGLPLVEARAKAQAMEGVLQTLIANAPQEARLRHLEKTLGELREAVGAAQRELGDAWVRLLFPHDESPLALSNGKDLSSWDGDPGYWSITSEGAIRGANREPVPSSTYLFTKETYRNFRLIFEVKQTLSAEHSTMHSAVAALGSPFEDKGANRYGFRGPLLMFCHDWGIWDAYRRNRVEPAGQRGPLQIPAERKGDWNLVEFLVAGERIQCAANGVPVFDFTDDPDMLQASPIGLQLHSNQRPQEFHFRHLFLAPDPGSELVTPGLVRSREPTP